MRIRPRNNKGFTLIELLVVIAIISLLSSVVFTSLNSARGKAKDAAIKEAVSQMSVMMTLNYDDYGSYCQLQSGWFNASESCSVAFAGNYMNKGREICNNIYNNAADGNLAFPGLYKMYANTSVGCATTYSFMVYLNKDRWYCLGSSGSKGEYTNYDLQPGCYNNP